MSIEAMNKALAALETCEEFEAHGIGWQYVYNLELVANAIIALRAAIEAEHAKGHEPVAVVDRRIPGDVRWNEWASYPDGTALYTRPTQSQQEAKPVRDWIGLTDDERVAIVDNSMTAACAIEATENKLREKNAVQPAKEKTE